jgi:CheY-like chemotaxis protein
MLLDQLGYHVVPVENGAAALSVLGAGERFDLVFSDIVMPGEPNGIELARQVRHHHPETRVLLATGYALAAAQTAPDVPILRKPYRLASLSEALRDVLTPGGNAAGPSH